MSDPYMGEIRMFAGGFAPEGWVICDGSLHPIAENGALFRLIGTTYGGDGVTTYAVPDLRGRAPVHQGTPPGGTPHPLGQLMGTEQVTLSTSQIPSHTHGFNASTGPGGQTTPVNGFVASPPSAPIYNPLPPTAATGMGGAVTGGSLPHDNMMPFLAVTFIMSLIGLDPSQS